MISLAFFDGIIFATGLFTDAGAPFFGGYDTLNGERF
jgi:hypothetical protein